jgi:hypothetical protein
MGISAGLISVDCDQHCVGVDAKAAVGYGLDVQRYVIQWVQKTQQLFEPPHFVYSLA